MVLHLRNHQSLLYLVLLFDPKLSFERHVRSVAASASQRISIISRGLKTFDSVEVVHHSFNIFILPCIGVRICSIGLCWIHLALLHRIVNRCSYLMNDVVPCNMNNRRSVVGLCMLYKVRERVSHP